jgi:hypothetical protein
MKSKIIIQHKHPCCLRAGNLLSEFEVLATLQSVLRNLTAVSALVFEDNLLGHLDLWFITADTAKREK